MERVVYRCFAIRSADLNVNGTNFTDCVVITGIAGRFNYQRGLFFVA
jgi:hypothetical protein